MARNFNIPAAQCGRCVIAEVEHLVENGEIDPDEIHLPGVYVDRVVHVPRYDIPIESRTVSGGAKKTEKMTPADEERQLIARRAALEFTNGMYVNLGIGIPTEAANYLLPGVTVTLQSENGLLGMGPFPAENKVDPE
uniref:Putative succinyl-CoA:3-ketoacid-coenzyme A transferase, mitochondrial n=1 Tax=Lygus hesperus TaxID=30085 RepID=A0A0A9ZD26_LYGHE